MAGLGINAQGTDLVLTANIVSDNGNDGINLSLIGQAGTSLTIDDNVVERNTGFGIRVYTDSPGQSFSGNVVNDNGSQAMTYTQYTTLP